VHALTAASWPDHLLTLAEWEALPEDASRRYELVEGVLLVVPRPMPLHQRAMVGLAAELDRQLPDVLTALAEVEVLVEATPIPTVRAPDVVVARSTRAAQDDPPRLTAADVLLAVEIVSPGTGRTDRVTKMSEYAEAGIPHYWLLDLQPQLLLTAHTLVCGRYEQWGTGTDLIGINIDIDGDPPCSVHLDLGTLTTRR
jgi:Uma2 family endonuclease